MSIGLLTSPSSSKLFQRKCPDLGPGIPLGKGRQNRCRSRDTRDRRVHKTSKNWQRCFRKGKKTHSVAAVTGFKMSQISRESSQPATAGCAVESRMSSSSWSERNNLVDGQDGRSVATNCQINEVKQESESRRSVCRVVIPPQKAHQRQNAKKLKKSPIMSKVARPHRRKPRKNGVQRKDEESQTAHSSRNTQSVVHPRTKAPVARARTTTPLLQKSL